MRNGLGFGVNLAQSDHFIERMQRFAYSAVSPPSRHKPEVSGSDILRHVARHACLFSLRTSQVKNNPDHQ